ncbi:MAG: hypothetical protein WC878_04410 [Candidatus Paceibacterota bacterium]|jgi:hypothetical protein
MNALKRGLRQRTYFYVQPADQKTKNLMQIALPENPVTRSPQKAIGTPISSPHPLYLVICLKNFFHFLKMRDMKKARVRWFNIKQRKPKFHKGDTVCQKIDPYAKNATIAVLCSFHAEQAKTKSHALRVVLLTFAHWKNTPQLQAAKRSLP